MKLNDAIFGALLAALGALVLFAVQGFPKIPGQPVKDPPVRILFVDPETGLPARTIVALPDRLEKPFFRADYSYPKDLAIEAPVEK